MEFDDVKGIHGVHETRNFSHRFFEDLEELAEKDFESLVVDVNVVYSVAAGRKYVSDLFAGNEASEQAQEVLGEDFFDEEQRDGTDLLQFSSTPYSRLKSIDNMAPDFNLYVPDITEACLSRTQRRMDNLEGVMNYFDQISEALDVTSVLGVDNYSRTELESAMTLNEDEAIVEASEALEDPLILSYDSDMLDYDIDATVPEIAYRILV